MDQAGGNERGIRVDLAPRRSFWLPGAVIWTAASLVGLFLSVLALLVPSSLRGEYGVFGIGVLWLGYFGYIGAGCWRAWRTAPHLTVSDNTIEVRLPGVLRSVVVIHREEVASVTVAHHLFPYGRPVSREAPIRYLLRNWRQLVPPPELRPMLRTPFNCQTLPDLSCLSEFQPRQLIVLMSKRKDIKHQVRWGLGWLQVGLGESFRVYCGPTRAATVYGLCASVSDMDQAATAFKSWPHRNISDLPQLPTPTP